MFDFDPKVAHLLRRATLGPTIEEIQDASQAGFQKTLDRMLAQLDRPLTREEAAAQAIGDIFLNDDESLRAGWMLRMLQSPNLFREKLTLFWHDHFATAISKVENTRMMATQIDTLRQLGLGDFRTLLLAVSRDPAMLIWLDNALNVKGQANENFGRELMELFTLGIGNYTEQDVMEVARAFTGWGLERNAFRFYADRHDDGQKTIFEKSGNFGGEDVINMLVARERTAEYVSWKMWRFFASQDPEPADLEPMVQAYKSSGRNTTAMLKAMFSSDAFFSDRVMGRQIKSPVEFAVGVARGLKADLDPKLFANAAAAMGQSLYNPPDVNGWPGGPDWISTYTLLERVRLVRQLVSRGGKGKVCGLDTDAIISENFISTNSELLEHFCLRFLHRQPSAKLRRTLTAYLAVGTRRRDVVKLPSNEREDKIRGLCRLILISPEYQLC
jgi:uncharacterized protein (DUF1800 family)